MKEAGGEGDTDKNIKKRETLLQRFGIPIEQVDYKYVETCSDVKKLERILRVLRSGEEGFYPDLEKFVTQKLRKIDPSNRYLRIEVPILRKETLGFEEKCAMESDLLDWIRSTNEISDSIKSDAIFETDSESDSSPPIRTSSVITKVDTPKNVFTNNDCQIPFVKQANPDRIKSWEYEKWNKFDVETELMKLEIEDMKAEGTEKIQRNKNSLSSMTTCDTGVSSNSAKSFGLDSSHNNCSAPKMAGKSVVENSNTSVGCSFIEELPNEIPEQKKSAPKRRVKIIIDDINAGGF